jgi:ubiquitin carboxyl-terminal hydrolase 34
MKDTNSSYKLVGVVVHIGTAEFGHYFSFIDTGKDEWMEFNDSKVKTFKTENLES